MQSTSHKPIEQTDDIGYLYGHVNLAITPDADLVEGRGLGFTAEQWEAETQPGTGAKHVKVCVRHDETNPVGHVLSTAVKDVDGHKHLMASLWINPNTPSGRAALEERRQGKLQYLSYGFRAQRRVQASKDDGDKGLQPFYRKRLREISLTDNPVFEDARIIVSCSNFDDDDTVSEKATEPQIAAAEVSPDKQVQTATEKAPAVDSSKTKAKDAATEQRPESTSVPVPMEDVQHTATALSGTAKTETPQPPLQIETVTEQRLQNVVTALEHISSSLSSVMATTATTPLQQTEAAPPAAATTAAATSLSVPAPADAADEPKLAEAVQKKARELEEMRQELERLRENAAELERIRQHKNEKAEKRRAEEEQKQRDRIAALAPKLGKAAGWGEDDAAKEAMFKLGTLEQTAPVVAAMEKMAEKIAHYEELEKRAKAQQEATRKDHQEAWRALSSGAAASTSSSSSSTKRKTEVLPPEQKKAQVVTPQTAAPAAATSKAQTPGDALGAQLQTLFNTNKFQPALLKEQQQRQPIGAESTKRQAVETADEETDNAAPSAETATSDPLMDKTPTDYFERAKQEQTYISVKCSKDITPAILNPEPSLWEGGAELPMDQKLFFAASFKDSVVAAPYAQQHPWMYNRNDELRRYGMFQPVSDERAALRRFVMPAWQAAK